MEIYVVYAEYKDVWKSEPIGCCNGPQYFTEYSQAVKQVTERAKKTRRKYMVLGTMATITPIIVEPECEVVEYFD